MGFDTVTRLETATGASLKLYIQRPRGKAQGVVQINHGLAEHAARYARFAAFLADQGFTTYVHDHRGHGHTRAPRTPLGTFGREPAADNVIADVLAVHERIAADAPGLPVILFGHSMGAMIAIVFLLRHAPRIQAAAFWNAPLASRPQVRAAKAVLLWERFRLGSDVRSRFMPRLTFQAWANAMAGARTPFDWLSRDKEEVQRYISDPLCGWDATVAMWDTVFDFNLEIATGDFSNVPKDMPIQLVGGGADPATKGGRRMRQLSARLSRRGFSNLETRIYAETRHESLNELNRNLIMEDFAAWTRAVAADI